jgi:hypothetical protein
MHLHQSLMLQRNWKAGEDGSSRDRCTEAPSRPRRERVLPNSTFENNALPCRRRPSITISTANQQPRCEYRPVTLPAEYTKYRTRISISIRRTPTSNLNPPPIPTFNRQPHAQWQHPRTQSTNMLSLQGQPPHPEAPGECRRRLRQAQDLARPQRGQRDLQRQQPRHCSQAHLRWPHHPQAGHHALALPRA